MVENRDLCQAYENFEICQEIMDETLEVLMDLDKVEMFNRICHTPTQTKQEVKMRPNIGIKRKMSVEESSNEPCSKKLKEKCRSVMPDWWRATVRSKNANEQKLQDSRFQNQNQENLKLPRKPTKGGEISNLIIRHLELQTTSN